MNNFVSTCIIGIVCKIVEDSGFNIESTEAIMAKKMALSLKEWMTLETNKGSLVEYEQYLLLLFNLWMSVPPVSSKIREEVWMRFNLFISSNEYKVLWTGIYQKVGIDGSPVLSFYITYNYFISKWKSKFSLNHQPTYSVNETSHLTYDEESALWYIGGYVIRQVRKKIKSSKSIDELLPILNSFLEDDDPTVTGEADESPSKENEADDEHADVRLWLISINRGGLLKCTNDFFSYLRVVELEMKKLFSTSQTYLGNPNEIASEICSRPSVENAWSALTSMQHTGTSEDLKLQILKLYVKIRVHCFVHKTIEHYKREKALNLQKTKSLRSKVHAAES